MFVTNWISTTKIQKISEITNFFRHYFLSRTEVNLLIPNCLRSNLSYSPLAALELYVNESKQEELDIYDTILLCPK